MSRRLPLIGVGLLFIGLIWSVPRLLRTGSLSVGQDLACVGLVASGLAAIWVWRRPRMPSVRTFLWLTYGTMTVVLLSGFVEMVRVTTKLDSLTFFHIVSSLLIFAGGPAMWGAALARRAESGSPAAQKAGRMAAGAVQVGFMFLFAAEVRMWDQLGMLSSTGSGAASAAYVLLRLTQLAERILLLWASIDSVRTAVDDEVIVRRAVRINRLLGGWLLLGALSILLSMLHGHFVSPSQGPPGEFVHLWRGSALILLTFAGTLAVFHRLTVRNAGPDTVTSGNSASGAEA
jgi:hypothetical protein